MIYKQFWKQGMYKTAEQKHFIYYSVSSMGYSHVGVCRVEEIPSTHPVAFDLV